MRVAWLPDADEMAANPYWPQLRDGLVRRGVDFEISEPFGACRIRGWRKTLDALHLHYFQRQYAYEATRANPAWVLRFARNLLLARACGIRTVLTLHNLEPTDPLVPSYADYLGHWCAANLTSDVIVHGPEAVGALRRRYGRRHGVHVIPHPSYAGAYPDTVTRAEARAGLGFAPRHRVALFLGGVRPNKGVETLTEAFRALRGEDYRLLIVGDPGRHGAYGAQIAAHAASDARIETHLARVPDDRLQVYLRAADVAVLPFARILTSGSAMLALTFGLPVLAPRMGCLSSQIGDAGRLYDRGGLLDALPAIFRDDLAVLGAAAVRQAAALSPDATAVATLRVYRG